MNWWTLVNRCRALENIAYVVAANQGASLRHYPPYSWPGGSQVVDFDGRLLAEASPGPGERIVVAPIDITRAAPRARDAPRPSHARAPADRGLSGLCGAPLPARRAGTGTLSYERNCRTDRNRASCIDEAAGARARSGQDRRHRGQQAPTRALEPEEPETSDWSRACSFPDPASCLSAYRSAGLSTTARLPNAGIIEASCSHYEQARCCSRLARSGRRRRPHRPPTPFSPPRVGALSPPGSSVARRCSRSTT